MASQDPGPGNAAAGRAIFEGKGGCAGCHAVAGKGVRTGPDLTDIGVQRPRAYLEQSLLDPDADVLPQNRYYRVTTKDGATVTGRILNLDTFSVQILDANEHLRSFQKSDLSQFGFVEKSPMPSTRGKLTEREQADLIAYLASLKGIPKQ